MTHLVPDYYKDFHCIAGACRHSCCIGWEIDIDDAAYERYRKLGGRFGERLRDNITTDGETASFVLGENERCPFLNSDGLCDIILTLGEDALCRICTDHPRFLNSCAQCDDAVRTETGLGLCCEAAAELILNRTEKVGLIVVEDDGEEMSEDEAEFYALRDDIIAAAQDRSRTINDRIAGICASLDITIPDKAFAEWAEILLSLERLDPSWDNVLKAASASADIDRTKVNETQQEQLLVYFLYRHLSGAADDGDLAARAAFSIVGTYIISEIARRTDLPLTEAARMYSSEIEYSEDNTAALLDLLFDELFG